MGNKTFYITTPIYYASGNLHIGHTYTTVICDVIARYKKMKGYDVFYLTGTDEHGEKIQNNAAKNNLTPKEFVDGLVVGFKDLWSKLHVDYDKFIRTTDEYHKESVQKIFSRFLDEGLIYKGSYEGWYCTPCESFWTEGQLDGNHCCPDCNREVYLAKEEAYFFKMSKFVDKLVKYYDDNELFIEPVSRKNEMLNNFIKPGLEDLCVSRTSFTWGVQVKEDPRHVVYVWIDALTNYINALGYNQKDTSLLSKYWKNDDNHEIMHVIGKEITRFHVIYWPIMLMALDLPLPTKVYSHGWIVMKDGKMSKSKGNVIRPEPLIEKYGLDSLRYFLTKGINFGTDGLFTPEIFVDLINSDLVNNYGNLLNRTASMINKYFGGKVPNYEGDVGSFDESLRIFGQASIKQFENLMDNYKIDEAYQEVMNYVSRANKYIEETQPWNLAKDSAKVKELESAMVHLVAVLRQAAIMLSPVLLELSEKTFTQLNVPDKLRRFETINDFGSVSNLVLNPIEKLLPRLDAKIEVEYIANLMQGK